MSKFRFSSIALGGLFKRKEYDPTQFETVNDDWDSTTTGDADEPGNVSVNGKYQNPNLPLEEQINVAKQKLEQYKKSLPNLK